MYYMIGNVKRFWQNQMFHVLVLIFAFPHDFYQFMYYFKVVQNLVEPSNLSWSRKNKHIFFDCDWVVCDEKRLSTDNKKTKL